MFVLCCCFIACIIDMMNSLNNFVWLLCSALCLPFIICARVNLSHDYFADSVFLGNSFVRSTAGTCLYFVYRVCQCFLEFFRLFFLSVVIII